jgi:FKBP-type peptidyl-prolyl cis-trans isomerase FkpA
MKSIRVFFILMSAALLVVACNKVTYRKTAGGMPYKLWRGNGANLIRTGSFVKVNLTQKIKDSVYFTTEGKLPLFLPVTEVANPYDISELWTKLHKGDSVIATQLMDTFIKRQPGNVPPQFKNGDQIVTTIKVLDVYTNDSAAMKDEQAGKERWLQNEILFVEKYLNDKKVVTQRTPSGAFVEIINPGTGALVDSGQMVSVDYTGTSFSGKKFDSNTDTSFHHVQPLTFTVGKQEMIKGFDEAMRFLRVGAVARVYLPSMLAYGARPMSPDIKPYEHLYFDIKVTGVKEAPPVPAMPSLPGMPQRRN